ncbi:hypothetical protein [Actinoplanes sp. L3-i22]|uniref:YqeB family protein n=1 Tax=Actinoplanes sp. L3-i22 TaxID=2836373 RepID=UPI001C76F155|nr:hypothetical protein [Actinoplanes sp. L3-i22]BCY12631.1 hypothetical protein L3i22_077190 [Actinoplanes sp. L3-i22]
MTRETAELGFSPPDRVLITFGPAALGLLLAVVLPRTARWALGLPVPLPFRPVVRVAGAIDSPWELGIQAAILVIVGLFATAALHERLVTVTVGLGEARFGGTGVPRSEITGLYPDGDALIALDRESRQVVRCHPRARRARLAETFRAFGYPWRDADPYADLYHPWESGAESLPPAADAVLSARAVALRKKAATEAIELRATLEKLGYAVRDEGEKQFWRPLVRS